MTTDAKLIQLARRCIETDDSRAEAFRKLAKGADSADRENLRKRAVAAREVMDAADTEFILHHESDPGNPIVIVDGFAVYLVEFNKEMLVKISDRVILDHAQPRPYSDWHDDDGCVLWWLLPVQEPPFVGIPGDSDWPYEYDQHPEGLHWTPLVLPVEPSRED